MSKSFYPGDLIYFSFDPNQDIHRIVQRTCDQDFPNENLYKIKKDWYMDYQLMSVTKETHPEEYL